MPKIVARLGIFRQRRNGSREQGEPALDLSALHVEGAKQLLRPVMHGLASKRLLAALRGLGEAAGLIQPNRFRKDASRRRAESRVRGSAAQMIHGAHPLIFPAFPSSSRAFSCEAVPAPESIFASQSLKPRRGFAASM